MEKSLRPASDMLVDLLVDEFYLMKGLCETLSKCAVRLLLNTPDGLKSGCLCST